VSGGVTALKKATSVALSTTSPPCDLLFWAIFGSSGASEDVVFSGVQTTKSGMLWKLRV
jgi:hypothetical protein